MGQKERPRGMSIARIKIIAIEQILGDGMLSYNAKKIKIIMVLLGSGENGRPLETNDLGDMSELLERVFSK